MDPEPTLSAMEFFLFPVTCLCCLTGGGQDGDTTLTSLFLFKHCSSGKSFAVPEEFSAALDFGAEVHLC